MVHAWSVHLLLTNISVSGKASACLLLMFAQLAATVFLAFAYLPNFRWFEPDGSLMLRSPAPGNPFFAGLAPVGIMGSRLNPIFSAFFKSTGKDGFFLSSFLLF